MNRAILLFNVKRRRDFHPPNDLAASSPRRCRSHPASAELHAAMDYSFPVDGFPVDGLPVECFPVECFPVDYFLVDCFLVDNRCDAKLQGRVFGRQGPRRRGHHQRVCAASRAGAMEARNLSARCADFIFAYRVANFRKARGLAKTNGSRLPSAKGCAGSHLLEFCKR